MRTTIDIPDQLMKAAKKRAIEEGITLKELFTRTLEKELQKEGGVQQAPWKELHGKGSAKELKPEDSGFDDYSGPDWNHAMQVNDPSS
ncbi:MAG: hypothetical protein JJU46_06530 [Balneolaceae bacterium]|nr:hypothetical protein [Balneolaceae bacterium]